MPKVTQTYSSDPEHLLMCLSWIPLCVRSYHVTVPQNNDLPWRLEEVTEVLMAGPQLEERRSGLEAQGRQQPAQPSYPAPEQRCPPLV